MSKILICYYSKSGNTEKMAKEISRGVEESDADVEVDLKEVDETQIESLPKYDCIILGSPTYYGLPCGDIKKFLDESIKHHGDLEGLVGGAFTSSANTAGGNETTIVALLESLIIHGMIVKGMPKGDHYGPVAVGEPGEKELKHCSYYGKWMAEFTEKIASLEV
ncbi:MAG: flavodoxin domain-containing protein [Candidatus Thermoplasmatota archaeon]|nr:flavodoxin domain-containing protein [Candidatus Thermoplasmatota archaeon]MBS3790820.1 flavodoxin domain-containing protein [Candidatus Thermoplasmatota archaeon]